MPKTHDANARPDQSEQRNINTQGGDYAEGAIDKRRGIFVNGTVQGNVIGQQTVVTAPLSRHDRDIRRRMVARVRDFWIKGVLEESLYEQVLIALNVQTEPQAVSFNGPRLARRRQQETQLLPVGTSISQVYNDAHQRLLILGAPGAGKTTLLLELARSLLDEADHDETRPLPVIFNLSSWAQQKQPLDQWLVQELSDQYGLGRRIAKQWLQANAIFPLLDGLDEVAEEQRAACVTTINHFIQHHDSPGIVVCSRVADYDAIGAKLNLDGAVQVQPLDDAQLTAYLERIGPPLAGLRAVLEQDTELRNFAQTPFLLNIMALTYHNREAQELLGLAAAEQRRQLFDRYVARMFDRPARNDAHPYTQAQTLHWLGWLAQALVQNNQTVFQIELMQPWWLRRWWQRGLYVLGTMVGAGGGGALLGALFGILLGLLYGLGIEVLAGIFPSQVREISPDGLSNWLGVGLAFGLVVGLGGVLFSGLFVRQPIRPTESLHWSWRSLKRHSYVRLGIGLVSALIYGLIYGLVDGLISALFFGLFFGLNQPELQAKTKPNQGTHRSLWHALGTSSIVGLIVGLGGTLIVGLESGLAATLVIGPPVGLYFGGLAFVQHYVLRLVCVCCGYAPWNYPRFLNYAAERILLRRIGGSYIFVHRMLLEHFAEIGRR
jgi:DNA polymerase III delta prime subunit